MARRRKSADDGGFGLILVLLLMALGVIVTVLTFLFQLAVTAAFYALPLTVVAALAMLRELGPAHPSSRTRRASTTRAPPTRSRNCSASRITGRGGIRISTAAARTRAST